ncbi:MAG TPA: C1 family peptidase [Bacteroidales bacterium]|nr:C1 family peptidase [Bacteroidales bacterium]
MKHLIITCMMAGLLIPFTLTAQEEKPVKPEEGYVFTIVKEVKATPVENQYRSSTCWSFSSTAFLESELLRMNDKEYDLSEMFVIYHTYLEKALKYMRLQGNINLAGGGAFHDVTDIMHDYGMVPESAYSGLVIGEENPVHNEMDKVIKAYMDAVISNPNGKLTPAWKAGLKGILDAYLGEIPREFKYNGRTYTPKSFAESLDLDPDDYVEIGSYTHHPFYQPFVIELPDNWRWGSVYNVPINEMEEIIDNALNNGYSVAWGADISDKGFSWKNGVAIVPEKKLTDLTGTEKEKWEKLTEKEKQEALYKFDGPGKEKTITQEMRQEAFDNYSLTDDHGMQITGIAKDQDGNTYYLVKNSWGTDQKYKGYLYASKPYVLLNTIDIMVHKDAIPKQIRKKLGF